ncbi:MAG TPA: PP2C family protein-serine/threonine phosphatase [Isosphaeraceae bacterium]|jgi:serine phosphatase RsbU (regulator of sigma subunit)|nr:PP2C family protein-serine/threonine phosphatase [Isosphaeraceae bacterium]
MKTHAPDKPGEHTLQCMEIWGGSGAVERRLNMPGLDAWVYSKPFEGASHGGDVHYVSLCGGGLLTRIIVADVSGHGAAVAEFATALRTLMRKYINSKSQTGLVRSLNRRFAELAQARRFATAVVGTYMAARDRLTICNAGHPRPLFFRAATREWSILTPAAGEPVVGANLPLGLDDETPYDLFTIPLGAGDVVLLYTDALTEAGADAGAMLGEAGLLDLARSLDPADPRRLGPDLLAAIADRLGGHPLDDDDVTLLALHHNAGPPRHASLAEKLDVYAKVFHLKPV